VCSVCPAGLVKHEDNLLVRPRSHLASEGGALQLAQLATDRCGEREDGAPGGRRDKADQPSPSEAVLHDGVGPRTGRRPDLACASA
jgi:hypothetical protein